MNYIVPVPNSSIPGMVWPSLPGTYGTMMLGLLGQFNESQWWPPELLRQMQYEQLDELLKHARETVPFYRDRLPGRHPQQDLQHYFRQLPVLTRREVQTHFDALQSQALHEDHGGVKESRSSGSLGQPVIVNQSAVSDLYEAVGLLRYHRWHNRNYMGHLVYIDSKGREWNEEVEQGAPEGWGWPVSIVYPTGPAHDLNVSCSVEQQIEWLQKQQANYLVTPPSNVRLLAEYSIKNNIVLPGLINVSTLMEVVTDDLRELCKAAWNVPLTDVYSCRELGSIAHQCPRTRNYHVCAENVFLEVLDENDRPCQPGESGRVVVTSLRNFAMPLIRYELSDHAEVGQGCECGRGLPVLTRVMGRVRNMLKLPSGEKRWARLGRPQIMKLVPAKQYQFVQTALDTIEVRLVPERPFTAEDEARLTEHFHKQLPYPYKLVYTYQDEIARGPGGKIEDFTCLV